MTREELVEKVAEEMAPHLFDGAPGWEMEREEIRIYARAAIAVVREEAAKAMQPELCDMISRGEAARIIRALGECEDE